MFVVDFSPFFSTFLRVTLLTIVSRIFAQNLIAGKVCGNCDELGEQQLTKVMFVLEVKVDFKQLISIDSLSSLFPDPCFLFAATFKI